MSPRTNMALAKREGRGPVAEGPPRKRRRNRQRRKRRRGEGEAGPGQQDQPLDKRSRSGTATRRSDGFRVPEADEEARKNIAPAEEKAPKGAYVDRQADAVAGAVLVSHGESDHDVRCVAAPFAPPHTRRVAAARHHALTRHGVRRVVAEWSLPFIPDDIGAPQPFWGTSTIPSAWEEAASPGDAAFDSSPGGQVAGGLQRTANVVADFMCTVSKYMLARPLSVLENEGEWRWSHFLPGMMAQYTHPFVDATHFAEIVFYRAEVTSSHAVELPRHFCGRELFLRCDANEPVELLSWLPPPGCIDAVTGHINDDVSGDDTERYSFHVVARRNRDGRVGFYPIVRNSFRFTDGRAQSFWDERYDVDHVVGDVDRDDWPSDDEGDLSDGDYSSDDDDYSSDVEADSDGTYNGEYDDDAYSIDDGYDFEDDFDNLGVDD